MIVTAVIADDITGANDIGVMYAKAGLDTAVYSYDRLASDFLPDHPVTVIDTNSRFCTPGEAYKRVYDRVKAIGREGAVQFFSKQCSVFRGNIGAEFDGMLDALGEKNGMVVLGFPDNGRTTVNGQHFVNGVLLEESQFRTDPVHPMTRSDLVGILKQQSKYDAVSIGYPVIDLGVEALKAEIKQKKEQAAYLVFDVRDNRDLSILSEAIKDEKVICGSSAPAYYLGCLYQKEHGGMKPEIRAAVGSSEKILAAAGSLTPQTKAQCRYMKTHGYPVFELDTRNLLSEEKRKEEISSIIEQMKDAWIKHRIVLVHTMQQEELVEDTKKQAAALGLSNTQVSELVSSSLAELVFVAGKEYQVSRFIICGGDTSASFCSRMGIVGMKILEEIEPGLPVCESISGRADRLVLKSGSFGTESFIEKSMEYL